MKPSPPNKRTSAVNTSRPPNGHNTAASSRFPVLSPNYMYLSSRRWQRLWTLIQQRRSRRSGLVFLGGLSLALALASLSPVAAQVRPLGASLITDNTPADLRTTLGDCPATLLRDAWTEMLPLEAAAVEREVLALCTERAEAMAEFLAAQAELDKSLRLARAVPDTAENTAENTGAAIPAPIQAVRAEVEGLRSRIARLESSPERPETAANLARLRAELAAAETTLRTVSNDAATKSDADALLPRGGTAAATPSVNLGQDAVAPASTATTAIPYTDDRGLPPSTIPSRSPIAAVTAAVTGIATPAVAAPLPPEDLRRAEQWSVVHVIRTPAGAWQAMVQFAYEQGYREPGLTPEDPPTVRWQPIVDPPQTVQVGADIGGGWQLVAVTATAVELRHKAADREPIRLPLTTDPTPGEFSWEVRRLAVGDNS